MAVQGRKIGQPMTPKKTKPSLKKTVDALAVIAEKHLSAMPEEEREKRIAAVIRREFTSPRDNSPRP
jgi:hypothetical protein